jgi:hypothetical protein
VGWKRPRLVHHPQQHRFVLQLAIIIPCVEIQPIQLFLEFSESLERKVAVQEPGRRGSRLQLVPTVGRGGADTRAHEGRVVLQHLA